MIERVGPTVPITLEEDAMCRVEGAARDARAHAQGARPALPWGTGVANYHGCLGELALHKHLGIPVRWTAWEDDAQDRAGLDTGPVQVKYNTWTWGDFYLSWHQGEMWAPYGVLVTPIVPAGRDKVVMLRAWLSYERWQEKRHTKDYGNGPVRAVEQADMFDMAEFPLVAR